MPQTSRVFLAVLFLCSLCTLAGMARGSEGGIGQVVFVQGSASIKHLEGKTEAARFGSPVLLMDTLETGSGELKVLFRDKTLLDLGAHSKVMLTENVYKPSQGVRRSLFDILKGKVRTIVDQSEAYQTNDVRLQTPTAVAGIRGTDVGTSVMANATQFLCFDGAFVAWFRDNPENGVMVTQGQMSEIGGPVPSAPTVITPQLMQQFSPQLETEPIRDLMEQPGGAALENRDEVQGVAENPMTETPTGGEAAPMEGEAASTGETEAPAGQSDQTQIIPGGSTATPLDAGSGGTSATVQIPVSFPHGVR